MNHKHTWPILHLSTYKTSHTAPPASTHGYSELSSLLLSPDHSKHAAQQLNHCSKCTIKTTPKESYPVTAPLFWYMQNVLSLYSWFTLYIYKCNMRPLHGHIYAHTGCIIPNMNLSVTNPMKNTWPPHKLHYQ